jgi:hypothetical protein
VIAQQESLQHGQNPQNNCNRLQSAANSAAPQQSMPAHCPERRKGACAQRDGDDPVQDLDNGIKNQCEIAALEQGIAD